MIFPSLSPFSLFLLTVLNTSCELVANAAWAAAGAARDASTSAEAS
jgi:hypothetical protein